MNKIDKINISFRYKDKEHTHQFSSNGSRKIIINMISTDDFLYSHWDVTMFSSNQKIKILEGGKEIKYYKYKNIHKKYKTIIEEKVIKIDMNNSIFNNLKNKFYEKNNSHLINDILVSEICISLEEKL